MMTGNIMRGGKERRRESERVKKRESVFDDNTVPCLCKIVSEQYEHRQRR